MHYTQTDEILGLQRLYHLGPLGPWSSWALVLLGLGPLGPWSSWALVLLGLGPLGPASCCPKDFSFAHDFLKFPLRNKKLSMYLCAYLSVCIFPSMNIVYLVRT